MVIPEHVTFSPALSLVLKPGVWQTRQSLGSFGILAINRMGVAEAGEKTALSTLPHAKIKV